MGLGSIGTYEVVKGCRILDFSVVGKRLAVDVANFGFKWYHTGADVQSDSGINNLRRRVFGFMALARRRGVVGVTFVFDGEPLALKMEVTHKKRREALKRGKKRAEEKRSSAETLLGEAKVQLDELCFTNPAYITVEPEPVEEEAPDPETHFAGDEGTRRVLAAVEASMVEGHAPPAEVEATTTETFVRVDEDGTVITPRDDDADTEGEEKKSDDTEKVVLKRESPLFIVIADELQAMEAMQTGDSSALAPATMIDLFARSQETMEMAIERAERQASRPCNLFFDKVRELAIEAGAEVRTAPDEAERECALMTQRGEADAAVSEDYDTLAFNAAVSIMQFGNPKEFALRAADVREALGMTLKQFYDYSVFCGCDYAVKPYGSGVKEGHKWIRSHGSIEGAADIVAKKLKGVTWDDFMRMVVGARGIFAHDDVILEAQREEGRRMKARDRARLAVFVELSARHSLLPAAPPPPPMLPSPPRAAVPVRDLPPPTETMMPTETAPTKEEKKEDDEPATKRPRTLPQSAPTLSIDLGLLGDEPE